MNAIDDLQAIARGRDIRTSGEIAEVESILHRMCACIDAAVGGVQSSPERRRAIKAIKANPGLSNGAISKIANVSKTTVQTTQEYLKGVRL